MRRRSRCLFAEQDVVEPPANKAVVWAHGDHTTHPALGIRANFRNFLQQSATSGHSLMYRQIGEQPFNVPHVMAAPGVRLGNNQSSIG
jgi:hypothetical protein